MLLNVITMYSFFSEYYYSRVYDISNPNIIHVYEAVRCLRKSYYTRRYMRRLYDEKVVTLTIGDAIHKIIQPVLKNHGYEIEKEVSFPILGITLIGHIDAYKPNHVLEIKSISRTPKEPLFEHKVQCNAYVKMANADKGYIVYINKRNGKIKIFEVKPDDGLFHYVYTRARYLAEHIHLKTPPLPERGDNCKYCEYTDLCGGV